LTVTLPDPELPTTTTALPRRYENIFAVPHNLDSP